MPPAEVLAEPSRSNSTLLHPSQPAPTHRKRSITMTTTSGAAQHSKLASALTPESRTRRNSTTAESAKRRFSAMMLRRPSQSTSASSSSSSSDQRSTSSTMSRRQSLTRATASSLAKVVPSFHNKNTNTESLKSSPNNGIHLLARRRNSMMALSNTTQPSTPKPSGSTVVKSSSSSIGANGGVSNPSGSKWFGLRRPSSPAIPSASTSSTNPRPRRYSMIPQAAHHPPVKASQNHMLQQDKHDSKLASLAKQQQRRMSAVQLAGNTPDRSISNSSTLKPKPNLPARHAAADKAAIVGGASVAPSNAACAEHSAAQDSYFEQHHPTETPRNKPTETCSRLSSRMLDSDISIGSIESRRSSVSSLRTVQSGCRHNNTTQHPAWLASAGFMRRTKCTACNPNSTSEHRRSLSRSSSMYDVAAAAQSSALRRLSRTSCTSLTEDNGSIKTNNRRIASADGTFDPPLTPIPNTTAVFIRQQQQRIPMPTAAATAAAAMAAAAAVVSAAAATAASTNPDTTNEKWMRLIGNCITHSNKLERLAQDLMSSEQRANDILEAHESMEDVLKLRDEQYQYQVKECEALVRAQREMLDEMESLLGEHGFKKEINTKQIQHDLTTPPPSSPSASSSSSIPSLPDQEQETCPEDDTQEEQSDVSHEQEAERSEQDHQEHAELSEEEQEQEVRLLSASPEPIDDKEEAVPEKPWNEIVEESISQFRWNVSQWVGGGVGTGQIVKCELGADGLMSTIIVAGTGVTTEPRLLPKHLMQPRSDKSVYYHQYILYIEREDRRQRFTLMPCARWVQDDQVKRCQFSYSDESGHIQCKSEFDWLARRHHCRRCGHIFCNTHSSNRLPLFDAQNSKAEWSRVCDTCFYDLAGSSLFHPSDDR
ncbi:hypothetical protein BJV82DRAFT_610046 [Fennellomyces sp. T-0311]|nr:hypothetical protein BJV82DRAFT_610046 [Fennellomyces sp. T-0311]